MKIRTFCSSIGVAAIALATATLSTGCVSRPITNPAPSHVVSIVGSGKKLGVTQDPLTQLYQLGYASVFGGLLTVPVVSSIEGAGTNQLLVMHTPDVVARYEIGGKATFFGSAGSTYTVAVGSGACNTLLGGQSPPVNVGYWTNSAVGLSQTLPANSGSLPANTTTTSTGTNGVVTTVKSVVVNQGVPGF